MEIDNLQPYEKNPRKNDDAVKFVAKSIEEFGFKVPIIIDKDNVIVAGHTRYKAAKKLKLKNVPCIVADDLTDQQIKAFRLADNKVAEKAEWDLGLLGEELDGVFEFDMADFGFEFDVDDDEPSEVAEDDFDAELPDEPTAKRGDIWQLGRHRLMCGDSTDPEDVEMLMAGQVADISLTSPPYGAGRSAKLRKKYVPGDEKLKSFYNSHEDKPTEWRDLMTSAMDNMFRFSKSQFINVQMLADNKTDLMLVICTYIDKLVDIAIWHKKIAPPQMQKNVLNNKYEFILIFDSENSSRTIRFGDFHGNISNVVECDVEKNNYSDIHKAVFPIGLVAEIIKMNAKCTSVLELFGGTGTTLIACEQLDRKCFTMELDPRYCDVIISRWEQFTGKKAVLTNPQ